MSLGLKLCFIAFAILVIAPEIQCLHNQNEHFSMNAHKLIQDFPKLTAKIHSINDNSREDYKILQDISDFLYKNATFWNHFKTALNEWASSNNTKNNSQCISDSLDLVDNILHLDATSLSWLDSFGKLPPGVFQGHFNWMGSYESCIGATLNNGTVNGKVCNPAFYLPSVAPYIANSQLTVGMCVPHTCDNETIADLLRIALSFSPITMYTTAVGCSEDMPFRTKDYVALVVLSILALIVVMGTCIDIYDRMTDGENGSESVVKTTGSTNADRVTVHYPDRDPGPDSDRTVLVEHDGLDSGLISQRAFQDQSMEISQETSTTFEKVKGGLIQALLAMSVLTNSEKLLTMSRGKQDLSAINGIRVISMSWVVLGHTFVFATYYLDNPAQLLKFVSRFTFQPILNGTFSVDSFFFLSGLLVAYLTLKELHRTDGKLNWPLFFFHRFWRLTPVYMLCVMFYATLFTHTLDGPLNYAMDGSTVWCDANWWTNLLYINNFYGDFANECFGWAWYLANDMQFFIISPIFIILLYRYPKFGVGALFAIIVASISYTTAVAYTSDMKVLLTSQVKPNATSALVGDIYQRPYFRISPYLVGILTGYLIYRHRGYYRLPKSVILVGWCMAIAIGSSVIYGLYGNYKNNNDPARGVAAFYIGIARFSWSVALAWVTYACVCGYGGPVNKFLSWPIWGPLGRLTYCVYLVHPMVIFWYLSSQQTLFHLTDITIVYFFCGNIVISYGVAFATSIFFEAPMIQLEKLIFKRQ